jgi:hypothetical protein
MHLLMCFSVVDYVDIEPIMLMQNQLDPHQTLQLLVVNRLHQYLPVGFLGIGEPLIYGVTLPLGRPFFTACIGGGIGGAVIGGIGHIGAKAVGPSGLSNTSSEEWSSKW